MDDKSIIGIPTLLQVGPVGLAASSSLDQQYSARSSYEDPQVVVSTGSIVEGTAITVSLG
jgi:hypothetical protein